MQTDKLNPSQGFRSKALARLWLACVLTAVLAVTLALSACGGGEQPTSAGEDSGAEEQSRNGSQTEATTVSSQQSDPTPTEMTQATRAPVAPGSTVEEYTAVCLGAGAESTGSVDDLPLEEFSGVLGDSIDRMVAATPPVEVADWHNATLAYQVAIKASIDEFTRAGDGRSQDEFLLTTLFPIGLEHQPAIDAAVSGMDPEVRAAMTAAGCIDDETVGTIPSEDTGTAPAESQEIRAGSTVSASLDEPEETDRYHLLAEVGEYYLIEVNWQDLPRVRLKLFQPPGYNYTFDSEISPISQRWTPDVSGTVSISVSAWDATGAYVLSISADPSPETPGNLSASWEDSGVRLTWDPVAGAEFYNIYHDDFSRARCEIDQDGNARRCRKIADNVVDATYLHTSAGSEENFYWIAACNSEGCSQVDSENPASLAVDQPGGPRAGGPCRMGVDLEPGDSCSVFLPGAQEGALIFEVREGEACYGDICGEESIVQNEFLAYANFDGSWFINRLPEGHPDGREGTPSPAPTPESNP